MTNPTDTAETWEAEQARREAWLRTAPAADIIAAGRAMEPRKQPTLADALEALAIAEVDDTPMGVRLRDHAVPAIRQALAVLTPHVSARADWFTELKYWVEAARYEADTGRCRQRDEGVNFAARIAEAVAFLIGERSA